MQAAIKAVKAGDGVINPDGTLLAGPAVRWTFPTASGW
ncbi:isoleucyl-tRNA synthetase [Mycobacterium tuberculosis]|nr:isoleucyl-tRNA synthetase [Mycobacterium tuberculosis]